MSENHSSGNMKSYELITEDLVKETLQKDRGENAELLSWKIKDFTNKGDGYMSAVTSINVKYKENEKEFERSYVAKLNPLRPPSSMTDFSDEIFIREPMILGSVIEGMNKHLDSLGQPKIKTPKFYACTLEKGREAFVAENLRTEGFVMHDKRKGQDLSHALLVMEELGRFHASSLLLQDSIAPKTYAETYEYFEVSWLDINNPSFKAFEAIFKGQVEGAIKILKSLPKYEKCVKWLEKSTESYGEVTIKALSPNPPFDVLIHGDSWTNNMLFKYDENNKPIDIRFVDFQTAIKASPASDIVYFLYSSLDGDVRSKYFKDLLLTYYKSFTEILNLAQRSVPFTFKELEEECEKSKVFGFMMAIMIVQGILFTEGDDIWDFNEFSDDKLDKFAEDQTTNLLKAAKKDGPFKDRFLSIFDDMINSNMFEENS